MSSEPQASPTIGPLPNAIRLLKEQVRQLTERLDNLQRQAPATSPIKRAFFGVVTKWQKNKVTACPMPFGDPTDWLTADYDEANEVCKCFSPFQLFERDVTPVIAIQFWNTDRPIVFPIHLATDDFDDPELPYWAPSADELEDPAAVTGGPPSFDDINCPGEED